MYNIDAPQRNLYKKDFKAHIEIRNYSCYTELNTAGFHVYLNDGSGNYSLIHEGTSYSQSTSNYTLGTKTVYYDHDRYTINTMKTSCNKFGKGSLETGVGVSFDATTGVLNKSIADDECYVYLDPNPNADTTVTTMANDIIAQAGQTVGSGQIVNENGYRFEGSNPNNYICLGTTTSPCPADNLYRIIGAFNEYNNSSGSYTTSYVTKVIKNKTYNNNQTFYWNSSYSNSGYASSGDAIYASEFVNTQYGGNPIYNTMNSTVYNSLDSTLKNQIATTRWYFKCYTSSSWYYDLTINDLYNYERNGWIYRYGTGDFNIGLISMSDYKYATLANICSRSSSHSDYNNVCGSINNNWIANMMYNSYRGWTWILNVPGYCNGNISCHYGANMIYGGNTNVYVTTYTAMNSMRPVYPVFYLNNKLKITKGSGTNNNPYYIIL